MNRRSATKGQLTSAGDSNRAKKEAAAAVKPAKAKEAPKQGAPPTAQANKPVKEPSKGRADDKKVDAAAKANPEKKTKASTKPAAGLKGGHGDQVLGPRPAKLEAIDRIAADCDQIKGRVRVFKSRRSMAAGPKPAPPKVARSASAKSPHRKPAAKDAVKKVDAAGKGAKKVEPKSATPNKHTNVRRSPRSKPAAAKEPVKKVEPNPVTPKKSTAQSPAAVKLSGKARKSLTEVLEEEATDGNESSDDESTEETLTGDPTTDIFTDSGSDTEDDDIDLTSGATDSMANELNDKAKKHKAKAA